MDDEWLSKVKKNYEAEKVLCIKLEPTGLAASAETVAEQQLHKPCYRSIKK